MIYNINTNFTYKIRICKQNYIITRELVHYTCTFLFVPISAIIVGGRCCRLCSRSARPISFTPQRFCISCLLGSGPIVLQSFVAKWWCSSSNSSSCITNKCLTINWGNYHFWSDVITGQPIIMYRPVQ
jgi:hypothetical protein